ncbi:MAG: gamma-glutamyltransferase [Bradymonadales bacterium]|nr:MAG: gamma-glutamyltransferase [Bradymonadales bacterium]
MGHTPSLKFGAFVKFCFLILIVSSCARHQVEHSDAIHLEPSQSLPWAVSEIPETHRAEGRSFAIASQGSGTSEAGAEMLKRGGNIVDAAVAMSFAVSVERPQSTGLGGGGFLLFYDASTGELHTFDFREVAPLRSFSQMYLNRSGELVPDLSRDGILAVGVPGLVAGLYEIHRDFGKLPWAEVLEPAIKLAEEGFAVYDHLEGALDWRASVLWKSPGARKIFFHREGEPLREGDLLVQRDLGRVLREIQAKGRDGFYRSWVGQAILDAFAQAGGLVDRADFEAYEVKRRVAVEALVHGRKIYSMPPPSSGGAHIIQMLQALSFGSLAERGNADSLNVARTVASMQQAFSDRASAMGDPDFVRVPLTELISRDYAQRTWQIISQNSFRASDEVQSKWRAEPRESDETTHFSLITADGSAVASTQTINGWFGSGVVVESTGIVLNNEMDDFTTKLGASNLFGAIGGEPNKIEPRKRPLSSMSPTIVLNPDTGRAEMALGSPAGTRIISCVFQTLLNRYEYGMSLEEAQKTLRYHHQWRPDQISVEAPGFPEPLASNLQEMGYDIKEANLGCSIQAVEHDGQALKAVSDPRGQGRAIAE